MRDENGGEALPRPIRVHPGERVVRRYRSNLKRLACAVLFATAAAGLVACGDDDNESTSGSPKGSAAEKAFLTGMVAHHESAIEMAGIAQQRGTDPFIKQLAGDITSAQKHEIATMEKIYRRLFDAKLKPDPGAHDGLGLTAEQAGMTHSPNTNAMLRSANPFDRAFVDEMVPHHRGAVAMSKAVLRTTKDSALRALAEGIISAQEREISEMNDFRKREFGAPVPADAGHGMDSGGEMEHEMGGSG